MENEEDPVSKQQISDAQAFGCLENRSKVNWGQEATAQSYCYWKELLIGLAYWICVFQEAVAARRCCDYVADCGSGDFGGGD
ncbi:hypothetical protein Tco_0531302 [Tanacetum coccineum]